MCYAISELFTGQIARLQRTFTETDVRHCRELTRDNNEVNYIRNMFLNSEKLLSRS